MYTLQACAACCYVLTVRFLSFCLLQYLHNEEEAIDMWKSVVNSINLNDKQKLDIVRWKQLFMQKVEPIVDERKKLNVQIQAHLPQVRRDISRLHILSLTDLCMLGWCSCLFLFARSSQRADPSTPATGKARSQVNCMSLSNL
jgi:hypothetical protein